MRRDGRLLRSYKDGARAARRATSTTTPSSIAGLLDLYEATGDPRWLSEAVALDGVLAQHYEDAKAGGFFLTGDDHEALLAREKPAYDGAEPSGNSVAGAEPAAPRTSSPPTTATGSAPSARCAPSAGILQRAPTALSRDAAGASTSASTRPRRS